MPVATDIYGARNPVFDDILYQLSQMDNDTEGQFEVAETKEALFSTAVASILTAGLTEAEAAEATAQLLQRTQFSIDAVAQVTGMDKDALAETMARNGFDARGNAAEIVDVSGGDPFGDSTVLTPAEIQAKADADAAALAKEADDRNLIQRTGAKVGEAIDSIFQTLGLPNPSKIIGAPNTSTGTVVWGQTSGAPIINTGTTGAGTQTGVTTGNAALDAVLNKVTGVLTGRIEAGDVINSQTAKDILIATASEQTGITAEGIEQLIEAGGDLKDQYYNPLRR